MAENQVNINLSLLDQQSTIKKRTAEVENLNSKLDKTQKLASGGIPATGTKTGAQALRATEAPDSTVRLQRTVVTTGLQDSRRDQTRPQIRRATYGDSEDYAMAGGVTGRGGASARDFADEARGLGGLVRLYATYAANVFAVSAAFSSLREAMNTDIMIRGMEQLGAQSGTSLVSMSKGFIAATDGMVSLREASEAVTKATSSGLGRDQVMAIAEVAKGASQALGLNMSDAVSRLTRGITKLEPELLDELGLFTKTGKAAEDYARSVGKSESQLSDFERRQAFANAVLAEGRQKFSEIAQEGNPFDQLLASLKNVSQDILSIVNTVVGPIAKLLANNTELITLAIGAAVLKISKQAIPVFTDWQDLLTRNADRAKKAASAAGEEFGSNLFNLKAAKAELPKVDKQIDDITQKLLDAKQKLAGSGASKEFKGRAWWAEAVDPKSMELSDRARQNLQNNITKNQNTQTKNLKDFSVTAQTVVDLEKQRNDLLERRGKLTDKIQKQVESPLNALRDIITRGTAAESAGLNILKEVPGLVSKKGFLPGLGEMYSQTMLSADLNRWGKFTTIVKGGLIGLAKQAAIFGAALSFALGPAIQAAILVFYGLDAIFSTNEKSARALTSAIESIEDSTKTAKDSLEKFMGVMSSASIVAIANSFNGITSSVTSVSKAFKDFKQNSSWFDDAKEAFSGTPGANAISLGISGAIAGGAIAGGVGAAIGGVGGVIGGALIGAMTKKEKDKASEAVAEALVQAVKSAPEGEIRDNLQTKLSAALGGVSINKKAIAAVLSEGDFTKLTDEISGVLKQTDLVLEKSKILVKNVEESTKKQTMSYQTLATSVQDSSPLTVFLMDTLKRTQDLTRASGDALASISSLESLAETGPAFIGLTGEQADQLSRIVAEYDVLREQEKQYRQELTKTQSEIEKRTGKGFVESKEKGLLTGTELAKVGQITDKIAGIQKDVLDLSSRTAAIARDTVAKTVDLMINQYELGIKKIAIEANKAMVGLAGESREGVAIQTQLDIEAINVEKQLADINRQLVIAMELGRISTDKLRDAYMLTYYKSEMATRGNTMDAAERQRIQSQITGITNRQKTYGDQTISDGGGAPIVVEGGEAIQQAIAQGPKAVAEFVKQGATAYQRLIPIMLQGSAAEVQAGLRIAGAKLQGVVKDTAIKVADELKVEEAAYTKLTAQVSTFTQGLTGSVGQLINNYAADIKDRLDIKKLQGQIDVQQSIIDSKDATKEARAAAEGSIKRLQAEEKRVGAVQKVQKAQREQNAEMQIAIEMTRALGEASAASAEAQLRLINTSTSAGMQAAESLRRSAAAAREGIAEAQFDITTAPLQAEIVRLRGQEPTVPLTQEEKTRLQDLERAFEIQTNLRGLQRQASQSGETATRQLAEIDIVVKKYDERIQQDRNLRDLQNSRQQSALQFAGEELQRTTQRMQIMGQLGLLTDEDLRKADLIRQKEEIRLKLEKDRLTYKEAVKRAEEDYQRIVTAEEAKKKTQGAAYNEVAGAATIAAGQRNRTQVVTAAGDALRVSEMSAGRADELIGEQQKLSDFSIKLAGTFKNSFSQMTDAIVNFVRTGKLNFKDLINSFGASLLQLELNRQMQIVHSMLFPSATSATAGATNLGSFIVSGIKSFFGVPGSAMGNAYGTTGMMQYAKGGIPGYAMGGAFTNKVVNQPTLFRAADGLGVMGEAGPEAIMPLRRGSNGVLGVEGSSSNVNVVVNNYGKERAEVKESTDGRGNRRIEVVVGEMVSGEMTRIGSPLQQTFSNTYGINMPTGRR